MTVSRKWRVTELNLVSRASKQRQSEDRVRADAWRKQREAELEAVVNRSYTGTEFPEIRALVDRAATLMAPLIEEFDRLATECYPAEFARPRLGIQLTPGGFPPDVRDKVRRDAAKHLTARHAFMLANSATYTTEMMTEATLHATDNPEVVEMLERLAVPNRATPTLEPPGPAIGILRKLLPHPEQWGFEGYSDGSPLLPQGAPTKVLKAPEQSGE
jgi:hypothetical protein